MESHLESLAVIEQDYENAIEMIDQLRRDKKGERNDEQGNIYKGTRGDKDDERNSFVEFSISHSFSSKLPAVNFFGCCTAKS